MTDAIEERGQVELVCKTGTYILQLSPHALAVLKKVTGKGIRAVLADFEKQGDDIDFETLGALVYAATRDHHPELSQEQASSLFPAGGIEEIVDVIRRALVAAFPSAAQAETGANPSRAATKK